MNTDIFLMMPAAAATTAQTTRFFVLIRSFLHFDVPGSVCRAPAGACAPSAYVIAPDGRTRKGSRTLAELSDTLDRCTAQQLRILTDIIKAAKIALDKYQEP